MKIDRALMKKLIQRKNQIVSQEEEMSVENEAVERKMRKLHAEEKLLFSGIFSILICCVMLAGATMAWYTASVSTPVTRIQSGTFQVDVQGASTTYSLRENEKLPFVRHAKVDSNGEIIEAETDIEEGVEPIWEPGDVYTLYPVFVANTGTMDMNFQLVLSFTEDKDNKDNLELLQALKFHITAEVPNGESKNIVEKELTFPVDGFDEMVTEIQDANGTVTGYEVKVPVFDEEQFLAAAKEEDGEPTDIQISEITIKTIMPLGTGQKYMNKTLNDIKIIVNASQVIPGASETSDFTAVSNAEELHAAISSGGRIVLMKDIVLNEGECLSIAEDKEVTLDLQGYVLQGRVSDYLVENEGKLIVTGGILSNAETDEGLIGGIIRSTKGEVILDNVTLKNTDSSKALCVENDAVVRGNFDLSTYCNVNDYEIGTDSDGSYTIKRKNEN